MTTSKPQASKRQMEEWIQGYSFLAPALLVIFVFFNTFHLVRSLPDIS